MKTIAEIKELIAQNIDEAFDVLDETPLKDNGVYIDLVNQFITRPENFDLATLRSRLRRLVSKSKDLLEPKKSTKSTEYKPSLPITLKPIPKPKPYFSGRTAELEELRKAFTANPLIYIEGAGGIGKTQLVTKFLKEDKQNNNILWYKCTSTSQPDDLIKLAGFDELLKGDNKTPRSKFSAFKDKMEQFDLLVILDDYQEVQHNENFKLLLEFMSEYLGNAHLLIIGRDNIITPNFQIKNIRLKGMGKESILHARSLVQHSYSTKRIADSDLKIVCNQLKGYPLAIDLGIYLLSEGSSPEEIIQTAIRETKSGEDFYEKISKRLLNEIFTRTDATESEKEFLKYFSIFRGNTSEEAIKSVVSETIFKSASKKLIRRNLLTFEDDLYSLHPLIREFCYEELNEKETIHQQAVKYFENLRNETINIDLEDKIFYHLSSAKEWPSISQTITEKGRDFILLGYLDRLQQMISKVKEQAFHNSLFSILEGDIAQIRGDWVIAQSLFKSVTNDENDSIKIESKIKYAEIIHRRGDYKIAEPIYQEALNEAINNGLEKWHARALNDIALIKDTFGDKKTALDLNLKSLEIREEIGDKLDIATSMNNIGSIKSSLGKKREALELYEKNLETIEEIGDRLGIARSMNNIGSIKSDLGEKKEALELYEKSFEIREEVGDRLDMATSMNNIGSIKSDLGEKKEALELYEKSFEIREEIGDKPGIANSLNCIGNIKSNLGEKKEALELYKKSLKIYKEIGDKSGIASSLSNIGNIKSDLGKKKEALELHEKSLAIREEIGHRLGIARSMNNIGSIKSDLGEKSEALELYEKILNIYIKIGYKSGIATTINNTGIIKSDLGEKKEALELYEKSLNIYEEIGDKYSFAINASNIGRLQFNNKKWRQAAFYFLKAYAIYKQIGVPNANEIKYELTSLRRNHKKDFRAVIQNAYKQLDKEQQAVIDMNDILGMPKKAEKKIKRNDSCPCGSGKKYKKCHGKN